MHSTILASWACVMSMVFQSVLAVGNKISAHPKNALVSEPLSVEILGGWKAEAEAVLRGGFELHSVESLHYAVEMIDVLRSFDGVKSDGKHDLYKKTLCSKSDGVKVESLEDAYHMASLLRTLDCSGKMEGKRHLVEQLRESDSVKEMLHALVAAERIKDTNMNLNNMCTKVASAVKKDGYSDSLNIALFLSNLRFFLKTEGQTSGEGKAQQFKACEKLMSSALNVLKNDVVAPGSNHPFFAPIFLYTMEEQDRPQLSAERVNLIASQLASAVFARGDSMQAVYVLASFQVIMSNQPPPIVVSIRPSAATASSSSGGKLSVAFTDLRGKSLQGLTEVTVDNNELERNPDNTWALVLGHHVLMKPGDKKMKFNLKSRSTFGDDHPHTMTQNFKVLVEVSVKDFSIQKLEKGTNHAFSGRVFSAKAEDTLIASFKGESQRSVSQNAVCKLEFEHLESGHHADFLKEVKVSDSDYVCSMKLKIMDEAENFLHQSGKYHICGSVNNPFNVADGELMVCDDVFIDFVGVPKNEPLPLYYLPLLHESDNAVHALPEQHHTHAPPHPKPPSMVTLLFCGFVVVPILEFVYVALRYGPKLRFHGDFLWVAVHHACLSGALICIIIWWFSVNFPVFRYLLPLVAIQFLFSNHITKPSSKRV